MKYFLLGLLLVSNLSFAVTMPNDFQPNTPARAIEVNENFQALVEAVNAMQVEIDNLDTSNSTLINQIENLQSDIGVYQVQISNLQADVSDLESARTNLQNQVAALESNTVLELNGYLSLGDFDGYDTAVFEGINLQINSGAGFTTAPVNGLGNLIVGYNGSFGGLEFCSDPAHDNHIDCEINSGTWDANVHTGSHNIIMGDGHSYTAYGGMVLGNTNVSNGNYASVLGGSESIASGYASTISGGVGHTAFGYASSINGGSDNAATAYYSSVSGGQNNTAAQSYAAVSGGQNNTASEFYSTVSGGENNTASGAWSSISGGSGNTTLGENASVSGGFSNNATDRGSSISGGRNNVVAGWYSSISGGNAGETFDIDDWVAGTLFEDN